MAKGNLLLGMGRGKLGDIVLYRQNGQQMSRPRTRVVKNPRTSGQQIQRMVQATIAYAYAGLKSIVDHSFEGVQYGGKSMNYFMKRNMDALRAQVIAASNGEEISARFAAPNIRVLYPNEYVVSNGSLTPFVKPTGNAIVPTKLYPALSFPFDSEKVSNLFQFMSYLGIEPGDQLTFLFFNADKENKDVVSSIGNENAVATALAIRRIKFKTSYTDDELTTPLADLLDGGLNDFCDSAVTDTDLEMQIGTGGALYFSVPSFKDQRDIYGGCCIRSRKQGEAWLRSTQTVYIQSEYLTGDKKVGFTFATAYDSWMAGTTPVGTSAYILNGKPNSGVEPEVDDEP